MKFNRLLLGLTLAFPVCALAQTPPKAPRFTVDPAAQALLDRAMVKYKAAKGLRFRVQFSGNGTARGIQSSRVSFQRPNLLRIENAAPDTNNAAPDANGTPDLLLEDGANRTLVNGKTYKRQPLTGAASAMDGWAYGLRDGVGALMPAFLAGRSPLDEIARVTARVPGFQLRLTLAKPALIDGDILRGVRIEASNSASPAAKPTQVNFYFDAQGLLSRISTLDAGSDRRYISTEQLSEQQLDPDFAPDTFKFNATGLTLAAAPKPVAPFAERYWDARLNVGAAPFAFSVAALGGQKISPANYKGKVLLLDFWATWCGPCVAGLPELQAAYDKYHARGLEVVGISLDDDKNTLTSFIKERRMAWPQVFDGGGWKSAVPRIYGVRAIPFLLVIGKDGKIAAVNPRGKIEEAVQAALAAK